MNQGPYIAVMSKLGEIAHNAARNAELDPSQHAKEAWRAHETNIKHVMAMVTRESQRIEAEHFALAAGVCEYRGGNEHGNPLCLKTNELI